MQHQNAGAAVDAQHCADASLDAVECIEHCFPRTKAEFPDKIKVALRVVAVYSTRGNPLHQTQFAQEMSNYTWRGQQERAKNTELVVSPGHRPYWGLVIMSEVGAIETTLNRVGAPQPISPR